MTTKPVRTAPPGEYAERRRHVPPFARFVAGRAVASVAMVWGVTVITFVLTNLVPADPLAAVLGDQAAADPEIVAQYRAQMGLNAPLPLQYWHYLVHLAHGNLGVSAQTRRPVAHDLAAAFPATVELAAAALIVGVLVGVGLGLVAALRRLRASDTVIRLISVIGNSVPTFWLALAVLFVFFYKLGWLPGSGRLDPALAPPPHATGLYTIDGALAGRWDVVGNAVAHLIGPALVLALFVIGLLVRFVRSAVLDVLGEPYFTAARAKGLSWSRLAFGYALRGALPPILTMVGLIFGALLSGAVLTEDVFAWNGLGQYAFRAATSLDLQAIMGVGLVVGLVYIGLNFLVDLVTGLIDPRVRHE